MADRLEPGGRGLFGGVFARGDAETGDLAWLQAMLDAEAGLARALERAGLAPAGSGQAVTAAAQAGNFGVDELGELAALTGNPVPGLARALARLVPQPAAGAVHQGATSQDILDTAAMLLARRVTGVVLADLAGAADAAAALASEHRSTIMIGRTVLQQAVPLTFGLVAAGWLTGLDEAREGLAAVRERRLAVQFGGAAGTLASLGDDGPRVAALLAEELGLALPVLPWPTDRLRIIDLAAALARVTAVLGKIARDVTLLAQSEVGEVGEGSGVRAAPAVAAAPMAQADPAAPARSAGTATQAGPGRPGGTATQAGSGRPGGTATQAGSGRPGGTAAPGGPGRPARTATAAGPGAPNGSASHGPAAPPRRGGSSAMPHKHNPVAAVAILGCTRQVPGLLATLVACAEQEHQRAAGAWHAEWQPLTGLLRLTASAAAWAAELLPGLVVDAPRMAANLAASKDLPLAEHVTSLLAGVLGGAAAHDLVAEAAQRAVSAGLPLRDVLLAVPKLEDRLASAGVTAEQVESALDPAGYLGASDAFVTAALAAHESLGSRS
jgi:3-carboxy-cis,cis-muconate cycloisomerase